VSFLNSKGEKNEGKSKDKWTKSMFAKIVENELPLMSTKTRLSVLSANPYPRKKG
jgi:hypothetical protein